MYIVRQNKEKKWIVIAEGKKRASKVCDSKLEAITYATKRAKEENTTFRVIDKENKHHKGVWIVLLLLLVILIGVVVFLFLTGKIKLPTVNNDDNHSDDSGTVIQEGDLSIHFLELGNYYAGDCVYIKAGDNDILIDAGSRESSSTTIYNYVKQYCSDNKLEYVIATHAHKDHISGFVGTKSDPGIFDLFDCGVIIDYAKRNTTSNIAEDYESKRDEEVKSGAKHYTAKDCIEQTNGALKNYQLTDSISFTILDQKYYYESSSDENNYSVCLLLNYGEHHFLFTGDLEKEGEESLVDRNQLPHCKLFKGGHHGSKTSSNEALLAAITPEVVCVCCCAGSSEYTNNVDNMFPTQDFINRVAKYTNRVYVTSLATYKIEKDKDGKEYPKVNGFTSMNGNIVVTLATDGSVVTTCSNNNTILKESEWFNSTIVLNGEERKMRTWPQDGK